MAFDPAEDAPSDEELAAAIARRDESEASLRAAKAACGDLYTRHARKLLAFLAARVHRNDLEDLHQGVWQRVWQHLPTGFHGGNFRAWLYQVARNHMVDQARKKTAAPLSDEGELPEHRASAPDELLAERERKEALTRCLGKLDARAADLVKARLAGESYDEICPRLGLKAAGAHKLFHQAKVQLQTCVERALA